MATNAAAYAERAMSDKLNGPDWAVNIELCDIINMDPRQAKDALKILKKRLTNKNPKIQLLALFLLETLSKNCGENVFQQIAERGILQEMVKMVKKKPELNVREKILTLIDTWQEALGGSGARYPQYYSAYNELQAAGVEFPPREENSVPIFTPPQAQSISAVHHPPISAFEDEQAIHDSLQSDASGLGLAEMKNAEDMADVLMEMLGALDCRKPEALKEEIIVELVDECVSYQRRVMLLVNSTVDEELLCRGLALNDVIQRVLNRHDEIAHGTSNAGIGAITETSNMPNVSHEDVESKDEFSQLSHRSSSRDSGLSQKPINSKPEPSRIDGILPPPPPPHLNGSSDPGVVDYLSDDLYTSAESPHKPSSPFSIPSPSNATTASPSLTPTVKPSPSPQPIFYEPQPAATSREASPGAWAIPPPPSRYNQRQQFFQQQQQQGGLPGSFHSSSSSSSYDSLVNHAQRLSLNSPTQPKPRKQEDALFKDLVDFAKAKSASSASSSKPSSGLSFGC
ncbi:hypothetical protein SAY87_014244 [Trapa incisa]|uniref:Target of Myb protein 1 n=1 Tax=Trapa incisa TaxID=236973 RepID=A0AAN7GMQ9_9MYRT|nr:hypothetical protein SAY87_014244 [Trapa incisa]